MKSLPDYDFSYRIKTTVLICEEVPMKHEYQVVYQEVEDGWIMATVPELPGAVTQGKDMDEARTMIREAVELLLESYRANAKNDAAAGAIWESLTVDVPVA